MELFIAAKPKIFRFIYLFFLASSSFLLLSPCCFRTLNYVVLLDGFWRGFFPWFLFANMISSFYGFLVAGDYGGYLSFGYSQHQGNREFNLEF